jgi:adenylate cyclase
MRDPVDDVIRRIARRNSFALIWLQFGVSHLIVFAGMGLFTLYQSIPDEKFWILVAVSQAIALIDNCISIVYTRKVWRPVRAWERGARDERSTVAAWTAAATLPLEFSRWQRRRYPLVGYVAFIVFATWELHLSVWPSLPLLLVGGTVVLLYMVIVRYFVMEVAARPVIERLAASLPDDFAIQAPGLPLHWRLLAAGPAVNLITGVIVSALSTHGHPGLSRLGTSWLIAVAVSFTLSLELVVLVTRSLAQSLRDLQAATDRVKMGDFSARVPVVTTDETSVLAQSFNSMVEGLDERERLRDAFGAYVDPTLAERVLREGTDLAGEDVAVTVLFLDIRDFTAFAETATPKEVVALLNGFWELVVPVLLRHGGHANKFIGDGLLGVFGAPERRPDHAERAVRAALEIAKLVRSRYRGEVGVGIGVNSGHVVAGTVGGGGRVEFTVIGDAVNTASRVEAATRQTGDQVLITETTRALLPEAEEFAFEERPGVPLKGKTEPVPLWAPAPVLRDASSPPATGSLGPAVATRSVGRDEPREDQAV